MLATTDKALVAKALKNNKTAWLKLVKRYEGLVYNYALRMVSHPEDARDLMQDVFVSVFRGLASWRGDASFKTWLMIIANRRCIEFYRRRKDWGSSDELESVESSAGDHPDNVYQLHQQGRHLVAAMQELPEEQRLVVELKFYQHLTLDAIGQQLGVSTNTVKSRLYAAVDKLKQKLEVSA